MRPQPNKQNRPVMLTADAVRRINRVVASYERGDRDRRPKTRTSWDEGDPIRLCKTTSAWAKDTTATLDVWESGTPPAETQTTGQTIDAVNKMHAVADDTFVHVALGANGTWYLIEAGDNESSGCEHPSIAGRDLTGLAGYDSAKTQALVHEAGCLKWLDIDDCPEGSGP